MQNKMKQKYRVDLFVNGKWKSKVVYELTVLELEELKKEVSEMKTKSRIVRLK